MTPPNTTALFAAILSAIGLSKSAFHTLRILAVRVEQKVAAQQAHRQQAVAYEAKQWPKLYAGIILAAAGYWLTP